MKCILIELLVLASESTLVRISTHAYQPPAAPRRVHCLPAEVRPFLRPSTVESVTRPSGRSGIELLRIDPHRPRIASQREIRKVRIVSNFRLLTRADTGIYSVFDYIALWCAPNATQ